MQTLLTRKYSIVALLLVVLGAFVAFGIIRYATRRVAVKQVQSTVASGKSLLGLSRSTKPKPAPGKPFVPETQTHLPIPTVWIPSPQSPQLPSFTPATPQTPTQAPMAPQAPPQVATAPLPQPLIAAKPSFAPLVYQARHEKHFGGSCSGQLTLNAAGLTFHCPDDPGGSVQIALKEIGAVDENGVQLLSGKKYHFSIAGMTKTAEQAIFANWLHQVR